MPPAQVELHHGDESLNGVVNLGNREQHLGVTHETESNRQRIWTKLPASKFVRTW